MHCWREKIKSCTRIDLIWRVMHSYIHSLIRYSIVVTLFESQLIIMALVLK